jgi:hypothetical protein
MIIATWLVCGVVTGGVVEAEPPPPPQAASIEATAPANVILDDLEIMTKFSRC